MTIDVSRSVPADVLDELEHVLFAAVGLTTVALAAEPAADLTLPQWRALVVIGRSSGLRVGELAARTGLSLPSTSRLVGRLERRGYVWTGRDPRDRRVTLVRMTASGMAVRSAVIERRRRLAERALDPWAGRLPRDLARGISVIAAALAAYE